MTQPSAAPPERINYAEALDQRTKMVILVGVLLSLFLAALDQTIVATSLPRIVADLQGLNLYAWVTTAYLLASTAMVPIYGKLSDIYGRKPILLFGIVVFLLGSALCGSAGEPFWGNLFGSPMLQLVVFRGLQGLGAAALTSVAFAIPADIFVPADRARYQGLFGAVFGLSSVIGPLLGGFLTDQISWRWVFYVNVPIGLVAIFFIITRLPVLASGLKSKVDYLGAILIVVFTVPLLLALTWGSDKTYAWTSPLLLGLFAVSLASLIAFLFVESRHESPIIPLTLFQNPTYLWSVVARFFIGAGFLGAILFLSLYLVIVQGVSATAAGTATIPLTAGLIVGSILSGQLAARLGHYKVIMLSGLALMSVGFWWLSTMNVDTAYTWVIVRMVVLGLGIGPALPLYNLAIQSAVKRSEIGVATSSGQFFQQMGSTLGTAVFGAVLTAGLASQFTANLAPIRQDAPPALQKQIDQLSSASGGGRGNPQGFDAAAIKRQAQVGVQQGFAQQRAVVTRALSGNDPAAVAALLKNPQTPANLRALLAQGSAGNQVPQAPAAAATARAQALQGALAGLKTAEQQAVTKTGETIDRLGRAIKVSYANTISRIYLISVMVVVLAFLATLMLPNLTLPKRGETTQGEGRSATPIMET